MDDGLVWVPKSAVVMPVIPEHLGIDPLLAAALHAEAFLNLSGDDAVDPDWAVEALEHMAYYLHRLSAEQLRIIQEQLDKIAKWGAEQGWSEDLISNVKNFLVEAGTTDNECE